MDLVDALVVGGDSHPVGVVLGEFLELPVGLAHFTLELYALVALLPVVRAALDHLGVGIDEESDIRFHQTAVWRLAPFEIETLMDENYD